MEQLLRSKSTSFGISQWSMSFVAASRIYCSMIAFRRSQSRFCFWILAAVFTAARHTSTDLNTRFWLLSRCFSNCLRFSSCSRVSTPVAGYESLGYSSAAWAAFWWFYWISGWGLTGSNGGPLRPTSSLAGRFYSSSPLKLTTSYAISFLALLPAYSSFCRKSPTLAASRSYI